ncbi:hypothetical protein E2C01_012352 [Portunus trituberculatus]|uniref:Uncharacterized protein n=1 Tax=Portunus trituberculatus TaxID=210409 RepID=A0A5B7DDR1_PORTR|nr:hypothetical protein [Portunus trituberculatus]
MIYSPSPQDSLSLLPFVQRRSRTRNTRCLGYAYENARGLGRTLGGMRRPIAWEREQPHPRSPTHKWCCLLEGGNLWSNVDIQRAKSISHSVSQSSGQSIIWSAIQSVNKAANHLIIIPRDCFKLIEEEAPVVSVLFVLQRGEGRCVVSEVTQSVAWVFLLR